jgi:hypothetical protein
MVPRLITLAIGAIVIGGCAVPVRVELVEPRRGELQVMDEQITAWNHRAIQAEMSHLERRRAVRRELQIEELYDRGPAEWKRE